MSWGRVPCGKHATIVCWGLARGEGEIRVRLLPDGVGYLACRREAVAGPGGGTKTGILDSRAWQPQSQCGPSRW